MTKQLQFAINKIPELLTKFGLNQTWLNLLFTHLKQKEKFHYITENKEFIHCEILKTNLLKNLGITELGTLYEYSLAQINYENKKQNGQYFTPKDVSELLASYSNRFDVGKWYDPCCGVGNLSWFLIDIQENREDFLKNNLILSDKDTLALFIARVIFTISFQDKETNLFNEIEHNFIEFDFLSVSQNGLFDSLNQIPKHDFVIVNPPYFNCSEDTRFETCRCTDLYAYFLENIMKTSKGFISITPQSFTNADKFTSLRSLLLKKFENLTIYCFDNVPDTIFKGVKFGSTNTNHLNSVRAAIIVAGSNFAGRKITSLLRWRTSERKIMFENLDKFLSDVTLTSKFFPKVSSFFADFYKSLNLNKTLGNIISNKETEYILYIPSSPRYFISALKKPVKRASMKTLYFENENDYNKAYLLLNSSLTYWWWRVKDGGMTLSEETLNTIPILDFEIQENLIKKLEASENNNKVYKRNAGIEQENVKHPFKLIEEINNVLCNFNDFSLCHKNSDLELLLKIVEINR
ncbi:MAG: N-6 DNA methylase [Marinilabiliaceae bacterium]|nr:N-6 DNA methylase [Marinilabiliaceae bacterium]